MAPNLAADSQAHDGWFRTKVHEALTDDRSDVSIDDVEAEFAERRAAALRKTGDA